VRAPLAAALLAALVLASPAGAHVVASPSFLATGETKTIELSTPNERDAPMTGLVVTVPAELRVVGAEETEGWAATVVGQTVTWSGGSLPAKLSETFGLRLEATGEPGALDLDAEQRYADGKVRWPVTLTIVPGTTSSDLGISSLVVVVIVGVGLLVTTAIALLAWRRRKSLQEG
jgi:uncharacterized protein YcnI